MLHQIFVNVPVIGNLWSRIPSEVGEGSAVEASYAFHAVVP